MKRKVLNLVVLVGLLTVSGPSLAHHAIAAEFD